MYGEAKIYIGQIAEVSGSKVKVNYTNTTSDFLPYLQTHNSFKSHFATPQVGEAVILVKLESFGFVFGSLPPLEAPTQSGEIITYSDGTTIKYDNGTLEITSLKELTIKCDSAKVIADKIALGEGGSGIITGESICPFTGSPHQDYSQIATAQKI